MMSHLDEIAKDKLQNSVKMKNENAIFHGCKIFKLKARSKAQQKLKLVCASFSFSSEIAVKLACLSDPITKR